MMKYILPLFLLVSCGADDSNNQSVVEKPVYSLAVTEDSLPECLEQNQHQLVYMTDSAEFRTCKDLEWVSIDIDSGIKTSEELAGENCQQGGTKIDDNGQISYICNGSNGVDGQAGEKGADGIDGNNGSGFEIVERYRFAVNSYLNAPNLAEEGSNTTVRVGDIDLVKFTNGTYHFSVSGVVAYDLQLYYDFSHDQWLYDNTDSSRTFSKKIMPYADSIIGYTLIFSDDGTISLSATVSLDGDFSNNSPIVYTLTKVDL